jgi:hypothetical protein
MECSALWERKVIRRCMIGCARDKRHVWGWKKEGFGCVGPGCIREDVFEWQLQKDSMTMRNRSRGCGSVICGE